MHRKLASSHERPLTRPVRLPEDEQPETPPKAEPPEAPRTRMNTPTWGQTLIAPRPTPLSTRVAPGARRTPLMGTAAVRPGTPLAGTAAIRPGTPLAGTAAVRPGTPARPTATPAAPASPPFDIAAAIGAALKHAARLLSPRRAWKRITSPLSKTMVRDLEIVLGLFAVIGTIGLVAPYVARSVPARLRASVAVEKINSGFATLYEQEEKIMRQTGVYQDPAKLASTLGITPLLDPTLQVVTSAADDSHWFLQVRSPAARTVCSSLVMTYVTWRGGGFRMVCRDLDGRDVSPAPPPSVAAAPAPRP